MTKGILLLLISLAIGCASTPKSDDQISESDYTSLVEEYTRGDRDYKGFYNSFEISMTLLNSPIQTAQVNRRSEYYQWSDTTKLSEREKVFQEMSSGTKVFISFFTPEREADDLDKMNTIWKIYLMSNGQRYQGAVKRVKTKSAELQVLYPGYSRFATPYMVTFNVPTASIEKTDAELTITGPVGTLTKKFPGLK
jgi:hypothetical protein